jgi:hypothetical protein
MAEKNATGSETSLKQLFQSMVPESIELLQGTVIQASPLKIQIVNDDKLIINERITIVPWHLTDYTTKATYAKADGSLSSVTTAAGEGPHTHSLSTYTLTKGTITVYNALKVGDKLHILALNNGKLYFVLDRVAS